MSKRNMIIGLVALAAVAAASTETATLVHKWKKDDARTYTATLLTGEKSLTLGKVRVRVISVNEDGSAQVEMKNDDDAAFTFTFGDHGKIEKDPGGKQALAAGLSLLLVVPRGEMTIGKEIDVASKDYGFEGDATTVVKKGDDGKDFDVISRITPKEGDSKYVFITTYAPEGGLPKSAALLMKGSDDKPQFVSYKADDIK